MTDSAPEVKFPIRFVVLTFVAAGAIGAAIVYFGLQGQLGAGVP